MDYFHLKINCRKRLLMLVKTNGKIDEETLILKLEEEFGLSKKMIYYFIEQYHNMEIIKVEFGIIYDKSYKKTTEKGKKTTEKGKKTTEKGKN